MRPITTRILNAWTINVLEAKIHSRSKNFGFDIPVPFRFAIDSSLTVLLQISRIRTLD